MYALISQAQPSFKNNFFKTIFLNIKLINAIKFNNLIIYWLERKKIRKNFI